MANPYQEVIDRLRGEKWSQRQDATLDQLRDVLPLIYAIGCYDAGEFIGRFADQKRSILEFKQLRDAVSRQNHEIEQTLGKALGYPTFYPELSPVDDGEVCVGEHVVETLAMEAAKRIQAYEERYGKLS